MPTSPLTILILVLALMVTLGGSLGIGIVIWAVAAVNQFVFTWAALSRNSSVPEGEKDLFG